jgi:hypothetical protein
MSETDDPARHLPRIREELDKLPLPEEQKAEVAPKILKLTNVLDTRAGRVDGGNLGEDSTVFDFQSKINGVVERFAAEGLTREDYLQAAVKNPSLFGMSPETVEGNIRGVVERFAAEGLTRQAYVKAAVRQPPLFYQDPETVEKNIRGVVERFAAEGLTRQDYVKAAVKNPSLFTMSPETVEEKHIRPAIERFAAEFAALELTARDYVQAAVKQPSLFTLLPETVEGNINGMVERFAAEGLTRQAYVKAAVNQPSLFTMSPETVEEKHIRGVVERFVAEGLTRQAYVKAAVRHPPLFDQDPDTIGGHIDLIFDLYDKKVFTLPRHRQADRRNGHPHAPVLDFLLANPTLLSLQDNNFVLRELHQRMTGADPSPKNLRRSRTQTEHELMRHLGHDDPSQPVPDGFIAGQEPPTEQQARNFVLRALAREGYLKSARLER